MGILALDLSDENVAAMALQLKAAQEAESKGYCDLALKIYWDLSFRGCDLALYRLRSIFLEGQLGVSKNDTIFYFLVRLPPVLEEARKDQKDLIGFMIETIKEWESLAPKEKASHPGAHRYLAKIAAFEHYLRDPIIATRVQTLCPQISEIYPALPLPPLRAEDSHLALGADVALLHEHSPSTVSDTSTLTGDPERRGSDGSDRSGLSMAAALRPEEVELAFSNGGDTAEGEEKPLLAATGAGSAPATAEGLRQRKPANSTGF